MDRPEEILVAWIGTEGNIYRSQQLITYVEGRDGPAIAEMQEGKFWGVIEGYLCPIVWWREAW